MTYCPSCSQTLVAPPSVDELMSKFPNMIIDFAIDRSRPRCPHCDEMAAHKRLMDVECPPPSYENPLKKLEADIERMKGLICEGIYADELRHGLFEAQRRWAVMVKERRDCVREAWVPFWGVWGVLRGQEGL